MKQNLQSKNTDANMKKQGISFSYQENIKGFRRNKNKEIHLLIGTDIYGKLFTCEIRCKAREAINPMD